MNCARWPVSQSLPAIHPSCICFTLKASVADLWRGTTHLVHTSTINRSTQNNGAIKVASITYHIGLSSTEAEVAALVKGVRCALDTYFIQNHIGFNNISKIIASGGNISCETLCTASSPTQKRSKHFNMNAVWAR